MPAWIQDTKGKYVYAKNIATWPDRKRTRKKKTLTLPHYVPNDELLPLFHISSARQLLRTQIRQFQKHRYFERFLFHSNCLSKNILKNDAPKHILFSLTRKDSRTLKRMKTGKVGEGRGRGQILTSLLLPLVDEVVNHRPHSDAQTDCLC